MAIFSSDKIIMKTGNKFDDVTLAMSLPENQREPILRALEYERNVQTM